MSQLVCSEEGDYSNDEDECPSAFSTEEEQDGGGRLTAESTPNRTHITRAALTARVDDSSNSSLSSTPLKQDEPVLWCPQFRLDNSTPGHLKIRGLFGCGVPKCPLCRGRSSKFYCQDCVNRGDFVHSSTKLYERYTEKNLRLFSLQREIGETKRRIEEKTWEAAYRQKLTEEIKQIKTKIKFLRHLVKSRTDKSNLNRTTLSKIEKANIKRRERIPEFVNKVQKIWDFVDNFRSTMNDNRDRLDDSARDLKWARADLVNSLEEIFPVEEVFPSSPGHSDVMLDCLAEAMKTSYIHGRWVTVDKSGEMQYRIVAPMLSSSGDYAPVYALIATSKEGAAGVEPQPAFNISGGLTLTTQLLHLIAQFTGVPILKGPSYSEFGIIDTSEYKFAKKVARLNINIINICLANGVQTSKIRPCQTLYNVKLLVRHMIESKDISLTYTEIFEQEDIEESFLYDYPFIHTDEVEAGQILEWEEAIQTEVEQLRQDQPESDSDEEGNDSLHEQEWESVPTDLPDLSHSLSSSPSDRVLERPSTGSGLSFVPSTVSSFIWGISYSPKPPRK